jgi:hypothetical protein
MRSVYTPFTLKVEGIGTFEKLQQLTFFMFCLYIIDTWAFRRDGRKMLMKFVIVHLTRFSIDELNENEMGLRM